MTWSAWAPAIVTVIFWVYTAGMTIGRIKDQELALKDHHDQLKDHGLELKDLGNRMTASEAWFKGYEAGKSK